MTETHKEMDKIKALLAEIGPERWYLVENGDDPLDICVSEDRVPVARLTMGYNDCIDDEQWRYAQLIVAARNHLPDIIEERDQAVSAYAGMKEALEAVDQDIEATRHQFWGQHLQVRNSTHTMVKKALSALHTGEAVTVVSDLQEENARLREALEPLERVADVFDRTPEDQAETTYVWANSSTVPSRNVRLSVADCRRAVAALSQKAEGDAS